MRRSVEMSLSASLAPAPGVVFKTCPGAGDLFNTGLEFSVVGGVLAPSVSAVQDLVAR